MVPSVKQNTPPAHLYGDACVLSCCQKWRSTSDSSGTQTPWYPCAFSCVLWGCSWQQKLWSTVYTWKAFHGCGCGCGGQDRWASWTPWSNTGSHASERRSLPGSSLKEEGRLKQKFYLQPKLHQSYLFRQHLFDQTLGYRLVLPGICIGFLKMLLFFSLTVFSGPCTFLFSSAEPSLVWFCGSLEAASPWGWTTLRPLFSRACYQRKQKKNGCFYCLILEIFNIKVKAPHSPVGCPGL